MNFNPFYGIYPYSSFSEDDDRVFTSKYINYEEAFRKGNIIKDEYLPYKDYEPKIEIPASKKENLLYRIQAYSFAAHDLNLYLDIHPNDKDVFALYNNYIIKAEELKKEYQNTYGPLYPGASSFKNGTFTWNLAPSVWTY